MAHPRLPILPEENSLRVSSPFQGELTWPPQKEDEQPRALRALSRIVDGGLCHRCGSCVGICPTGVLALDEEEYPTVKNLSACTDCDLCVKVCPGDEFSYEDLFEQKFGRKPELEETHGEFQRAVLAHASDESLRAGSTSGGLVTALLVDRLKRGEIDGAVVIQSDEDQIWKGKPVVARSEAELLQATKSKYAISPTNLVFEEILRLPGRYALVGLPCQIHGFEKAAELQQALRERVVLTIGLFCHAAIEHEAFRIIWDSLGEKTRGAERFVSRIGKHPGAPHLQYADGSTYPVYFGEKKGFRPSSMEMINILYRLYTPARCLTCFDALAEFADIAVGDPWMAPPTDEIDFHDGWSFALLRSARGEAAFQEALEAGAIGAASVTRKEALACNKQMATEKRWRAFRMIETHRRQGKSIPNYGRTSSHFPHHGGVQFVETELHMLTHIGCFLPRIRGKLLRFFLGEGGYRLLWLNNKRRTVKFFLRDQIARIRRNLFGRGTE
ncbi:Coenzyme F420 hydrogenase/dehydrogenase, beta subunit C-terminal domain [bacterium]|nr:Coenzyme F420 hydrogenase/dehydrogenase, beta subunit C-terminal domain [bacterium]